MRFAALGTRHLAGVCGRSNVSTAKLDIVRRNVFGADKTERILKIQIRNSNLKHTYL